MRILVTGGAGFIGSHLAEALAAEGHRVTLFDNLTTGRASNVSVILNDKVWLVRGDVCEPSQIRNAAQGHDVIYHLAALASVRHSFEQRHDDFRINVVGTRNTLEAAVAAQTKRFIFVSSSAVYGKGPWPASETFGPMLPTTPYGASKVAGEVLLSAYAQGFGFVGHIFRLGRIVGGRMRRGVVWDFLHKLERDPKHLEILGNGKQRAAYLHATDVAQGLLLGLTYPETGVAVTNLVGTGEITADDVADEVIAAAGLEGVGITYTGGTHGWKGDMPVVSLRQSNAGIYGWRASRSSRAAVSDAAAKLIAERGGRSDGG